MLLQARFIFAILFAILLPAALTGCAGQPDSHPASRPGTPSRVTRAEVLTTAMRYAAHPWTGTAANVKHGPDAKGIRIDTPDITYQKAGAVPGYWIPGALNHGLPYQWGGFSTPAEFDRGLAAGFAAGDVYTSEKRAQLYDAVSTEAVGIDCSGFVSRCWNLPKAYSTRELASLCDEIPWEDLRPGDALNIYNAHVLIFSGWTSEARTYLAAYETGGPPDWRVTRHIIATDFLKNKGYRPLRYRGIRDG
jgi:cell wall-associated NlpC family hydrolase